MSRPTTKPNWATDTNYANDGGPDANTPTKDTPSAGIQAQGHRRGEYDVAQYDNWFKNLVYRWIKWLDDVTNGLEGGSALDIAARVDLRNNNNQLFGNLIAQAGEGQFVFKPEIPGVDANHSYAAADADVIRFGVGSLSGLRNATLIAAGAKTGSRFRFIWEDGTWRVTLKNENGDVIGHMGTTAGDYIWVEFQCWNPASTTDCWRAVGWEKVND